MSYEVVDACNGCAECISCGRKDIEDIVYHCDYCGDSYEIDELRREKCGKDIFLDCYLEKATAVWEGMEKTESVEEYDE